VVTKKKKNSRVREKKGAGAPCGFVCVCVHHGGERSDSRSHFLTRKFSSPVSSLFGILSTRYDLESLEGSPSFVRDDLVEIWTSK
jgi:hypothetical protein